MGSFFPFSPSFSLLSYARYIWCTCSLNSWARFFFFFLGENEEIAERLFFTRNKTSNLNRDYIEEDTFQVISSWKERKITSSNLFKNWNRVSKNSGGRKESGRKLVCRARRQWPEEHRVPRSRTFRHEIMGGFCSTSAEKKKKIVENGYVARVRKGTCKKRRLTNLICSRETRLERLLRNLVWKFNNWEKNVRGKEIAHASKGETEKKKVSFFTFPLLLFKTRLSEFSKQDLELALSREILEWKNARKERELIRGGYIWWMIESGI